jgi:hypothetical protein
MIRRALSATAFATCLAIASASARDAAVGGVLIALSPPEGYCELDAANAADATMIAAVEGMLGRTDNRLLLFSAECGQLADWRAGKRQSLDNVAQHQTSRGLEHVQLPASPEAAIEQHCTQMRAGVDQLLTDMTADMQERAGRILKTVKINEMKFLGVVGQEPRACYAAALLQRSLTEGGTLTPQVTMVATTIVRQRLLYYYLIAPYVSGETVGSMLEQHKANVRRLHSENGE